MCTKLAVTANAADTADGAAFSDIFRALDVNAFRSSATLLAPAARFRLLIS